MESQLEKFHIAIKPKTLIINICSNSSCKASILLNKGFRKKEIEEKPDLIRKQANFTGIIETSSTLNFDQKTQSFLQKFIHLDIILIFPNEVKLAGKIRIDLGYYANYYKNGNLRIKIKYLNLLLS